MKIIFIFLTMLLVSSYCVADSSAPKPVYFANGRSFSIDGYDFNTGAKDPSFPITENQSYFVVDEGKVELPTGSYRRQIRLINPEDGREKVFFTRIMSQNNQMIVKEVKELKREISSRVLDDCDGFCEWGTIWKFNIRVAAIMEDNYVLVLTSHGSLKQLTPSYPFPPDFLIAPGDEITINFEDEDAKSQDFQTWINILRNGHSLPSEKYQYTSFAVGATRQDFNQHGDTDHLYIVEQSKQTNGHTEIKFYNIDGLWVHNPPSQRNELKGRQFELVEMPNPDTLILKRIGDGKIIEFSKVVDFFQ